MESKYQSAGREGGQSVGVKAAPDRIGFGDGKQRLLVPGVREQRVGGVL